MECPPIFRSYPVELEKMPVGLPINYKDVFCSSDLFSKKDSREETEGSSGRSKCMLLPSVKNFTVTRTRRRELGVRFWVLGLNKYQRGPHHSVTLGVHSLVVWRERSFFCTARMCHDVGHLVVVWSIGCKVGTSTK